MTARSLGSQNFVAERSRKSRSPPNLNPVSFAGSCPVAPVESLQISEFQL